MKFLNFWKYRQDKSKAASRRRDLLRSHRKLGRGLSLEALEDRRLLTVITPTSFGDTNATFVPFTSSTASISVPTLRDAVIEANYLFDNGATAGQANTIKLNAGTYTLSLYNTTDGTSTGTAIGHETASTRGDLNITSNLTIQGVGVGPLPLTTISQSRAVLDRVFEINADPSTLASPTTVTFQNLNIQGGQAVDDGSSGAIPNGSVAEGGGILDAVTGLNLKLCSVVLQCDTAFGANNAVATTSGSGPGPASALGGGLYVAGSTLSLTNVCFNNDSALGGSGLNGTSLSTTGGNGGTAEGGGLYVNASSVTFGSSTRLVSLVSFSCDKALGGLGGTGYTVTEGTGGAGGYGGYAFGGGMAVTGDSSLSDTTTATIASLSSLLCLPSVSFSVDLANFSGNKAIGGAGGTGGGGTGGGGTGGSGGNGSGGGLYVSASAVSLAGGNILGNLAQGGAGGASGTAIGSGTLHHVVHAPLDPPTGGDGLGGGLAAAPDSGVSLTLVNVSCNTALGGKGNVFGTGGGYGGDACGGGLYANTSTLTVVGAIISGNLAHGGVGGGFLAGSTGTTGGYGGDGSGGGIYGTDSQITLTAGLLACNRALGGTGGAGATGLTGGYAYGGAIYADSYIDDGGAPMRNVKHAVYHQTPPTNTNLTLAGALISGNLALGGNGGAFTITSGTGGNGGDGVGGAVYVDGPTTSISLHVLMSNTAQGGNGGSGITTSTTGVGGVGGNGIGGALYAADSLVTVSLALIDLNYAKGGKAGTGGSVGGDALGAAIFVDSGATVTLQNAIVMLNIATAAPGAPLVPVAAVGGVYVYDGSLGGTPGTLIQSGLTLIYLNFPLTFSFPISNVTTGPFTEF